MASVHNERGSCTAETAILVALGIAGLLAMSVYVQRALQGNIFGTTQSIGLQYDPRDQYREEQHLDMTEQVRQQTRISMVAANHLKQPEAYAGLFDPRRNGPLSEERMKRTLESLPTGRVLREPAFLFSLDTANWNATTDSEYRDQR